MGQSNSIDQSDQSDHLDQNYSHGSKCYDMYNKFANSTHDNQDNIIHDIVNHKCFDESVFNGKNINDVVNPLNSNQQCKLVTNKRTCKYIYKYDGKKIFDEFIYAINKNQYSEKFADYLSNIFDFNVYEKCCNCISIVLYIIKDPGKYIYSILQTVKNVEKYLPFWVVRLYFDISVHHSMFDVDTDPSLKECYLKIINSESVELYTFACEDFLKYNDNNMNETLRKTRFLRFLTFIDPSVKTCVVREADGVVSPLDCYNIRLFEKSSYGIYLVPFVNGPMYINNQAYLRSYSNWLNIYKYHLTNDFFKDHNNLYDVLAGLVSINFKIKHDVFFRVRNYVLEKIHSKINTININNLGIIDNDPKNYLEILTTGFDEIFLLELFKDIISCEFSPTLPSLTDYYKYSGYKSMYAKPQLSNDCIEVVSSFILSTDNIEKINYSLYDKNQNISSIINNIFTHIFEYIDRKMLNDDLDQIIQQLTYSLTDAPSYNNISKNDKYLYYNYIIDYYMYIVHRYRDIKNVSFYYLTFYDMDTGKLINFMSSDILNTPLNCVDVLNYLDKLYNILENSLSTSYYKYFKYKKKYLDLKKSNDLPN